MELDVKINGVTLKLVGLIEWPKIIKHYKLKNTIDLFFEYDEDYNKRFLTLSSTNNISYLNEFK